MHRRTFLQLAGMSLLVYGCGTENNDVVVNPGPGVVPSPGSSNGLPPVARLSQEDVFAFDGAGGVYEAQPVTGRVQKVGSWSVNAKGLGPNQVDTPVAVAVDETSRVWVADRGLGRVQLFDGRTGSPAGTYGDSYLRVPQDVAISGNRAYVSDALLHGVAVFDMTGTNVARIGTDMNYPRGIAFDPTGRLHVVEAGTHRVRIFSRDGQPQGSYGAPGGAVGAFVHPRGIAIRATDGLIAVADSAQGDLEFFSSDLRSLGNFRPGLQPLDLQFGPEGALYLTGLPRPTGV